jgi:hypothetical protein
VLSRHQNQHHRRVCYLRSNISSAATYTLVCSQEHTKVIEGREKFHWPRLFQEDVVEMTSEQLHWLMDGYDVWSRPHKSVTFTHVS